MTLKPSKNYQLLFLITILFSAIVLFWGLGSLQLMSLNEGRRAIAAKEMFLSGNWLLPTQNGELYLTKPPFFYWISTVLSLLCGGVSEWTLRLQSAFSASAIIYMVYQYTKKYFGYWAGLFSIQILIANVGFVMLARRAEIEMLLTALCLGALITAMKYIKDGGRHYWIYLSYFLLGLAVLTKGPVAMLFVTVPLIAAAFWTKDLKVRQFLTNKTGWLIFLIIGSSWYLAVTMKLGPDIWATIVKRDMIGKMQGEGSIKPVLSYAGWIAVDFLLLISLFFYKIKSFWYENKNKLEWAIPMLAVLLPFVIFSAFSNKHAKYLLPIYPVIAILLGIQLARILNDSGPRIKTVILSLGVFLPLVFAVFYMFIEPKIFHYRVAAFSQVQKWSLTVPVDKVYAFELVDSRLVYYIQKPVTVINEVELDDLLDKGQSLMLMDEGKGRQKLVAKSGCILDEFQPYLKYDKKLTIYGFGKYCVKNN
ncbi:MAG: ArnT family glycosyltransferase [Methylophilus sp.]